jgi:hypothetical protein
MTFHETSVNEEELYCPWLNVYDTEKGFEQKLYIVITPILCSTLCIIVVRKDISEKMCNTYFKFV